MEISKFSLLFLGVVILTAQVDADENYWDAIYQYMMQYNEAKGLQANEEAGEKLQNYVHSLTAEQLVMAAWQCSEEIQQKVPVAQWGMDSSLLGFFYTRYPQVTDDLKNIDPLLNDLQDSSQSPVWRINIMKMLGSSWRSKLGIEHSYAAAYTMRTIYSDSSELPILRSKAVRQSTLLLKHAYQSNLRNDPNVASFIANSQKSQNEYIAMVQSGQIGLSQSASETNAMILDEIQRAITAQLDLFANPDIDIDVPKQVIVAWSRLHEYNLDLPQVAQSLSNAVENYSQYDERLWHLLAMTSIEFFENENTKAKIGSMIDQINDQDEKKLLIWLQKEIQRE